MMLISMVLSLLSFRSENEFRRELWQCISANCSVTCFCDGPNKGGIVRANLSIAAKRHFFNKLACRLPQSGKLAGQL